GDFLWHIIPYLIANRIMFAFVAWKIPVFRGEQYNLALFPLWIQAVLTVFGGDRLNFNVTPKERQSGIFLKLVQPQMLIVAMLALSCLFGLFALLVHWRHDTMGVAINIFWGLYDIFMLSVIIRAAVYRPHAEAAA
ncbi:MAG: cellulose synthase, partial [Anaerolineae bacterium]|nr:cellulose synthase [Anaerolineae bacterium]